MKKSFAQKNSGFIFLLCILACLWLLWNFVGHDPTWMFLFSPFALLVGIALALHVVWPNFNHWGE